MTVGSGGVGLQAGPLDSVGVAVEIGLAVGALVGPKDRGDSGASVGDEVGLAVDGIGGAVGPAVGADVGGPFLHCRPVQLKDPPPTHTHTHTHKEGMTWATVGRTQPADKEKVSTRAERRRQGREDRGGLAGQLPGHCHGDQETHGPLHCSPGLRVPGMFL